MPGTSRPTTASTVNASCPKICDTQNVSNPPSTARLASATTWSTVPSLIAPLPIPSRMRGTVLGGRPMRSGQGDKLQPVRREVVDVAVRHQQHLRRLQLLDELGVVADEDDRALPVAERIG